MYWVCLSQDVSVHRAAPCYTKYYSEYTLCIFCLFQMIMYTHCFCMPPFQILKVVVRRFYIQTQILTYRHRYIRLQNQG